MTILIIIISYLGVRWAEWPVAPAGPFPGRSLTVWSPQIARLEQTWVTLRQRHTEGAILYEKKLKPFLKSLNEGKGIPLPPGYVTLDRFQPSLGQQRLSLWGG